MNDLRIGDPSREDTDLGAIISSEHLQKVNQYVALSIEEGGVCLTGVLIHRFRWKMT